MKATGIVRRIDDLGRIVIPKEMRKNLHIREADPIEIYVSHEGDIILRKYSELKDMENFAKEYCEALAEVSGKIVAITDRNQVIAVAGGCKGMLDKPLTKELEQKIDDRESVIAMKSDKQYIPIIPSEYREDIGAISWQMVMPIICQGDIVGSVIFLDTDGSSKPGEVEKKLLQSAATFLGKKVEQ